MSSRRMFSTKITTSAPFLKMPLSAQALYFHLALNTDDDGVVEGFSIIRMLSASEDDLQLLINKGFVKVLNEDLVLFITHWHEHNLIRADRKIDSIYKDLLLKVVSDIKLVEPRKRSDLKVKATNTGQPVDVQMTPNGQHNISKVKLSKVNIIEDNINIIIDYFNDKTGKNKYKSGSDLSTLKKYINEMIKSGDTIDNIKTLIDYKLANPNTKNIDLLSWLNTKFVGQNMSAALDWNNSGRKLILDFNKPKKIEGVFKQEDYTNDKVIKVIGFAPNQDTNKF